MTSDSSYSTKINPNPKPRQLDNLDVKFWWLFWDWVKEQSWNKTAVNAPSIADWLNQMKDEFTIYLSSQPSVTEEN